MDALVKRRKHAWYILITNVRGEPCKSSNASNDSAIMR
jgi:hypothetical protein